MKNLFKFTALATLFMVASCSKEAVIVRDATNADAIRFSSFMDQTTKATIFDNSSIKATGFGIMGYSTSQLKWNDVSESATPDFMYNQHVSYNSIVDNDWGYNPVKYWSNIAGDKYSFFAYAPYSESTMAASGIKLSASDATGAPVISFTINSDAKSMVDLVAGQEINIQQQQDAVKFNLKHQLTRVTFSATTNIAEDEQIGTGETYVVIKSMDLVESSKFYGSGDYTFDKNDTTGYDDFESETDTEADHNQDGKWRNLAAYTQDYPFLSLLDVKQTSIGGYVESGVRIENNKDIITPLFLEDQYLFLLPPDGQDGLKSVGDMKFLIEYQIVTADEALHAGYTASESKISTVSFPEASLKQGRAYNIILTIDLTEIKVEAVVIDWDETETIE
ncbi:MAG: fimbrillin family protein [Rikenellaceae bacterium]